MSDACYGTCNTCGVALDSRYHSLSRNVERHQYNPPDADPTSCTNHILRSDRLEQYCGAECAWVGAYSELNDRGISLIDLGKGKVSPCSKCGKPIDLTQPHVAYELMDQTEIRQPWLLSVNPHDSKTVARLCSTCDGDLAAADDAAVGEDLSVVDVLEFGLTQASC